AVDSLMEERTRRYENALLGAKQIVAKQKPGSAPGSAGSRAASPPAREPQPPAPLNTGVDHEKLLEISRALTTAPREFNLNPKVTGLLSRRAKMVEGSLPVDWGMAEALSFGSLLLDGIPIRLAGQDTVRGTFSHRHAAFFDTQTDEPWTPLRLLTEQAGSPRSQELTGQAGSPRSPVTFQIYDSPLSEAGVLGFEYGYSIAAAKTLVLWEAQFGDFVNAAQVVVDQFIASGEEKWDQKSHLVLLLPHGYEGQGPEHSSARLERFLQLAARGNIRIAYPSTSAQYFHLLRRQATQSPRKP